MDEKNYTEVLINGNVYTLGGAEDPEYLQKVAAYINEKIAVLKAQPGFTRQNKDYQEVMIYLNLADDYFKTLHRTGELLAPAGAYESMVAAVNAGADAVYIGGSRFGARAYANNLDEETMVKAIDFMHLHGCRIYMTVNTLVKEKEMSDLYSYLKPYYEAGLDAVLLQDMEAFTYIRKHFPDLPVHISTQMTVTGKYSARDLKALGAVRVVPARDLSL